MENHCEMLTIWEAVDYVHIVCISAAQPYTKAERMSNAEGRMRGTERSTSSALG